MLGLGHSLVGGSLLDSVYSMTKSFQFDGADDTFLPNYLDNTAAVDGTAKSITKSISVAAWVKFDDDSTDPYNNVNETGMIISCSLNGGWKLFYLSKRFTFFCAHQNGDGVTFGHTVQTPHAKMRAPTSETDYNRYLHKSDGWHLVIATSDMENRDTEVVTNLYVDGNRDQAGNSAQDGSSGVAQYGSEPETTDSKKTTSGGDIIRRFDTEVRRDKVDITIGSAGNNQGSEGTVTTFQGEGFQGSIGDVAIWEDVVLTQDDIANLYNLHVPMDMSTIQSSKLVGYWRPTKGLNDSVSGATGTLVDDSAVVTDSPSLDVSGYYGYR